MGKTPENLFPKYPIYIISKGRHESRLTSKALEKLGVPYFIAVEQHEYDKYCSVIDPAKVLCLPWSNHGKGSGPARNWVWEHSIANGHERHWILDDNITEFWRFHYNQRIRVDSGSFFRACEDFVDRYTNVGLAGLQYKFFVMDDYHHPPIVMNTRLMSCILIKNDITHRWRAKYNEDVDLSLRVLKDGLCTILFYSFLQGKMRTGTMKGGNTEELYGAGTFEKSKMLVDLHPDCVKLVRRYGRWHHDVDMRPFRNNKFILKDDIVIPKEPNEYGMVLVEDFGTPNQHIVDKPKPRK
jgi:hypothetical protein